MAALRRAVLRRAVLLLLAGALPVAVAAQIRTGAVAVAADLAAARDQYVRVTHAYSAETRARAFSLIADALTRAGELDASALHLRLLEIVALADNGHDVVVPRTGAARPALRMPYRVAWFPDALLIVRAAPGAGDLAGARIEAIDGVAVPELYRRLSRYAGGVEAERKLALALLLESPALLHAAGIARVPDRLTLELRLPRAAPRERTVLAVAATAIPRGVGPERLLVPDSIGPAEAGWTAAIAPDAAPLSLRDGSALFRLEPLLEGSVLYVQFRINRSAAGQDIGKFQERVVSTIGLHHPTDIVLDLRFDRGGDLQDTLTFMRSLPARVPGRVYVLISRYTFSAGIVSAAAVRKGDSDRVVLVGEPPGDRMRFWSEGGNACLPNSGFCLHYTDGLFDLVDGCAREAGCYGDQFDVNAGPIEPAIRVPFTAGDYLAGRDRAVDTVLGLVR